jgi:hypothetical protein
MGLISGLYQYNLAQNQYDEAKKLKESEFTSMYTQNRDLALQQAYSRRAPGQAYSEEMIRRNQANQVAAALKMYGGDANKIASISSSANAQANDATARLQAQGQAFSEDAFRRLYQANRDIQGGKLQYRKAKDALITSAQQNEYAGIPNLGLFN